MRESARPISKRRRRKRCLNKRRCCLPAGWPDSGSMDAIGADWNGLMLIGRHSIGNTTPAIFKRLTSRVCIPSVIHRSNCSRNCICVKLITLQVALFQQHNQISDMRSYDFVSARTHDGRTLRLLTLLDEYTRECLAIRVERRMGSLEVIETLSEVMLWRGIPEHIRSDNGPEFVAQKLRQWLGNLGTGTLYIEPGSPWENGYCESFHGKLRDECLNGEIFYSLQEAQIVIELWREEYNTRRPHSALDYRPPAPGACNPFLPPEPISQPQAVM